MKEPFPGIDQAVFNYVKERIRRLDGHFMMAVDDTSSTLLSIESRGKIQASVDISADADVTPLRLNCQMWLHASERNAAVETNSWDASEVRDEASLELLSSEVADWVTRQLQLVMVKNNR